MGQLQLFVVGMRCRRCVREVTARLRDIPGVDTVAANPTIGSVRLTGSMRYADVLAALAGTEYTAHLDDSSNDHTGKDSGTDTSVSGVSGDSAGSVPDSGQTGTGQTSR